MKGIIVKGIGGFYYVKADDGEVYECKARGVFRKRNMKPVIGDRVEITLEHGAGNIEEIGERRNVLVRPPVSNVDNLMVVAATKNPEPDFLLIDKMLVTAEAKGIVPMLCVNKTDLKPTDEFLKIYENTGYHVFSVSAEENTGIDEMKKVLKGKVTALAGLSGVGKSSILNQLTERGAATGKISRINRGKHTTRHVELFELEEGGFVFDTPGFSSFEPEDISAAELSEYFPEMKCAEKCRFKGCAHISEPDCAVKALLFDGKISPRRYESYTEIYDILKKRKDWEQ